MNLRSIREHVGAHNWFAVTVDLIIVVLGVFLGMQVTNWNEERLERQQGRVYYGRIGEDMATDAIVFAKAIEYYGQAKAHAEAALAALQAQHARFGEQFLVDAYQATQIAPRPVSSGAYEEAVATGVFKSVADAAIRDRIANYYLLNEGLGAIFNVIPPYRERLRRAMPHDVVNAILAACGDRFGVGGGGAVLISMPETCDPDLTPAQVANAVAQLRATPELALDLNRHINDLGQKLASFQLMIDTGQQLRADMGAVTALEGAP